MTQIQKYFGIEVTISDIIEPHQLSKLGNDAMELASLVGLNSYEYFVYIHYITIRQSDTHWADSKFPQIKDRVNEIRITHSVNPKQKSSAKIKFYNYFLPQNADAQKFIVEDSGMFSVDHIVNTSMLPSRFTKLDLRLITFICSSLIRNRHKKIKLCVTAKPSDKYRIALTTDPAKIQTQFDVVFQSTQITMRIRQPSDKERQAEERFIVSLKERLIHNPTPKKPMNQDSTDKKATPSFELGDISDSQVIINFQSEVGDSKNKGLGPSFPNHMQFLNELLKHISDSQMPDADKKNLSEKVAEFGSESSTKSFSEKYMEIVKAAGSHMAILNPFIPKLKELLGGNLP
jgi:hypothetical protein